MLFKLLTYGFLLMLAGFLPARACVGCVNLPAHDLVVVPESERTLARVIIGLQPRLTNIAWAPQVHGLGLPKVQAEHIDQLIYWIDLHLAHGGLLMNAPVETTWVVAVPDPRKVSGCSGKEKEQFIGYLRNVLGWSQQRIDKKILWFVSAAALEWSQDFSFSLGIDSKGRQWMAQGSAGDIPGYGASVAALAEKTPEHYRLWSLPKHISAEGGDMCLAVMPNGKPGILLGRHRVMHYFAQAQERYRSDLGPSDEQIEMARTAYSEAYAGLPVHIIPQEALKRQPEVGDEIFHLDMAVITAWVNDKAWAFVPFLTDNASDANSRMPLDEGLRLRAGLEYDLIAAQLKSLGFEVGRVPLADHPVRSPANGMRFRDFQGQPCLMIPRFPHHQPSGDMANPQNMVQQVLGRNVMYLRAWQNTKDETTYKLLERSLTESIAFLNQLSAQATPNYEAQAEVFKKSGLTLLPSQSYVWGAGSLHCMSFH
jgi:hypothetical protein